MIRYAMALVAIAAIAGCSDDDSPTSAMDVDVAVVWSSPKDGQVGNFPASAGANVMTTQGIQVRFNQVMDITTLDEAVDLRPAQGDSGVTVRRMLAVIGGDLLVVQPSQPFDIGAEYTLEITTGALAEDGRPLAEPFSMSFLPEPQFELESTFPVDGAISVRTSFFWISLVFNAPADPRAVRSALTISPEVPGLTLGVSSTGNMIGFYSTSSVALQPNTEYTITIDAEAADLKGNRLPEAQSFSFKTGDITTGNVYTYVNILDFQGNFFRSEARLTGDDPTVKLRGEIYSEGEGVFFDSVAVAVITVNDGVPEVLEVRKNKYSAVLTLAPGANAIEVEIESDDAVIASTEQTVYYTPVTGTERLVVTLEWGTSFTKPSDFDLHLIGPDGSGCYYANPNPDWGVQGDSSDDPLLLADVTEGGGFSMVSEVIQIADPAPGTYRVQVHFFDDFADERPIFPQVSVNLDGVTDRFYTLGNTDGMVEDDVWEATTFTVPGDNSLTDTGRNEAPRRRIARAQLPAKRT